jgi:hypothetical protein
MATAGIFVGLDFKGLMSSYYSWTRRKWDRFRMFRGVYEMGLPFWLFNLNESGSPGLVTVRVGAGF